MLSSVRCLVLTAACCAFIQRLVFSAVSSCCGLGAMQWSGCVTMGKRHSPMTFTQCHLHPHFWKQLVPPSTGPQSLWEFSAQAELLLAFPHPRPQIQLVICKSAATHPSVFKPHHILLSLCGFVQCRILLLSYSRVSRRSWRKSLRVVCT